DVRLFDRVVTDYEVAQLFQQSPIIKGRWQFEEGGSATPDSSLQNNALQLHGGAGIAEYTGRVDLHALELDGSAGYAAVSSVPVDTSASFTVAGWAQGVGALEEPASVVSASGAAESAFAVRFLPNADDPGWGEWQVALPGQDAVGAEVTRIRSQTPHHAASWTHVAVVYDGFAKEALLYVNGRLEEVVCTDESEPDCAAGTSWAENVHAFQATHSLQVGRSRIAGAWGEHWPGAIDDLWLFQGALNSSQVAFLSLGVSDAPTTVP
ncbi:LamG domain-containing protein, partial [Streptomyces sp. ACA25]|uniref:LamG-like jellyroll fold domain-containing protein n=1 Tax=Streptomyces sp. ACA25 TaxID=3022596 RepID=UPI002FE13FCD|nr:LamG domain-containing protein [Streptomyces sp. ACA25]